MSRHKSRLDRLTRGMGRSAEDLRSARWDRMHHIVDIEGAGRCEGLPHVEITTAWTAWGFHFEDLIEEPKSREVITIYEIDATGNRNWASAVYSYLWTPQTDPFGVVHETIDYPGVPVDHDTIEKRSPVLEDVRVPLRLHFGTMGLAPSEADFVDSVPPNYFGGNIDNWRVGKGGTMYYPVAVEGALLSAGDPHAGQGDSELAGTAIETSLTGGRARREGRDRKGIRCRPRLRKA